MTRHRHRGRAPSRVAQQAGVLHHREQSPSQPMLAQHADRSAGTGTTTSTTRRRPRWRRSRRRWCGRIRCHGCSGRRAPPGRRRGEPDRHGDEGELDRHPQRVLELLRSGTRRRTGPTRSSGTCCPGCRTAGGRARPLGRAGRGRTREDTTSDGTSITTAIARRRVQPLHGSDPPRRSPGSKWCRRWAQASRRISAPSTGTSAVGADPDDHLQCSSSIAQVDEHLVAEVLDEHDPHRRAGRRGRSSGAQAARRPGGAPGSSEPGREDVHRRRAEERGDERRRRARRRPPAACRPAAARRSTSRRCGCPSSSPRPGRG